MSIIYTIFALILVVGFPVKTTGLNINTHCPFEKAGKLSSEQWASYFMGQKYKLLGKEEEIVSLFDTGKYTFKELAKKYNVSPEGMKYCLNKNGRFSKEPNEVSRKYNLNQSYFDNLDDQNKYYILGLLFSDGCNIPKDNKVIICLKTGDEYLLKQINGLLDHTKPLYKIEPKDFVQNNKIYHTVGHYKLTIISKKMSLRLEGLGMVAKKSLKLEFPTYIPNNMLPHFIRGYFDGDGCASQGRFGFVGTLNFMTEIKNIFVNKIGITDTKILKHCKSNVFYYRFAKKSDVKLAYDYLYTDANLFLKRKRDKVCALVC